MVRRTGHGPATKERTSMQELRDRLIALRERIAHVLVRL